MAYINILADVLSSVAGTIVPPGAEPSRNVMMAAITFLAALCVPIPSPLPGVYKAPMPTEHCVRATLCTTATAHFPTAANTSPTAGSVNHRGLNV